MERDLHPPSAARHTAGGNARCSSPRRVGGPGLRFGSAAWLVGVRGRAGGWAGGYVGGWVGGYVTVFPTAPGRAGPGRPKAQSSSSPRPTHTLAIILYCAYHIISYHIIHHVILHDAIHHIILIYTIIIFFYLVVGVEVRFSPSLEEAKHPPDVEDSSRSSSV